MPSGTPIADAHGSRILALGIILALFHRERTGEGQRVDISLLDALMATQTQELVTFLNDGPAPERSKEGIAHVYTAAPYGVYETSDGYLALAMTPMPLLAEVLDLPDLAEYDSLEAAYDHRDEIKRRLQEHFIQKSTEHWLDLLGEADIWCGRVYEYADLPEDPQIQHNGLFQTVDHPRAGELTLVGSPINMSATPPSIQRPSPLLGQHTVEILHEEGLDESDIADLLERGIVEGEPHG